MKTIDCAILAGGKSTRMMRDKAFLTLEGKTLIEHIVALVNRLQSRPKIITNTPEKFDFLNLPCHTDLIRNAGPLGGIYTALKKTTAHRCLILACDLPFITEELILRLSEEKSSYDVLVVDAGKGLEPLCAVYSKSCIPKIKAQLDQKNYKVADIFTSLHTKVLRLKDELAVFDSSLLFNINTPDEYGTALKINQTKKNGNNP